MTWAWDGAGEWEGTGPWEDARAWEGIWEWAGHVCKKIHKLMNACQFNQFNRDKITYGIVPYRYITEIVMFLHMDICIITIYYYIIRKGFAVH